MLSRAPHLLLLQDMLNIISEAMIKMRSNDMKRLIHQLIIILLFLSACSSDDRSECITTLISNFQSNQEGCSGATIVKYEFQGEEVYAFTDGICINDGGTQVWDTDCNSVCFLGGIAGFTLCNEVDFFAVAVELEVIFTEE